MAQSLEERTMRFLRWMLDNGGPEKAVEDHLRPLAIITYFDHDPKVRHNAKEKLKEILPYEPKVYAREGRLYLNAIPMADYGWLKEIYSSNRYYLFRSTYEGITSF